MPAVRAVELGVSLGWSWDGCVLYSLVTLVLEFLLPLSPKALELSGGRFPKPLTGAVSEPSSSIPPSTEGCMGAEDSCTSLPLCRILRGTKTPH